MFHNLNNSLIEFLFINQVVWWIFKKYIYQHILLNGVELLNYWHDALNLSITSHISKIKYYGSSFNITL